MKNCTRKLEQVVKAVLVSSVEQIEDVINMTSTAQVPSRCFTFICLYYNSRHTLRTHHEFGTDNRNEAIKNKEIEMQIDVVATKWLQ